jgi:pyridoxamine 5'-phosphate oxidase
MLRDGGRRRTSMQESAVQDLREDDEPNDPFELFRRWYADAQASPNGQPDAMALATATPDGRPSVRMVLFKGLDERGFVFYTNYESRKGEELTVNPRAALAFFWYELQRSVRIEGQVERVSPEESDAYFASRALGSRISAAASNQSRVIPDRETLEARVRALEAQYGEDIPRPANWGGFRVAPQVIEFWQGKPNRLHDRLRYRRDDGTWVRERLAP